MRQPAYGDLRAVRTWARMVLMSQSAFDWSDIGAEPVSPSAPSVVAPEAEPVDTTFTVGGLNRAVSDALRAQFPTDVWVRGEIRGFKVANGGHVYFSLVERVEDREESLNVSLFRFARNKITPIIARHRMDLADGIEVRISGQVDFYAPSGRISLKMTGIDPTYTLGRLAADRDALIARLHAAGLLDANKRRPIPVVPLRVGLVTSIGSAAFHDFTDELDRSGYAFEVTVCDTRVQGADAPGLIAAALRTVAARDVDVVCVVRGGGSRTDLAAFDDEQVALAIARCPRPVLVGVGHEIDSSVADLAAHLTVKTPTACAQQLVDRVRTVDELLDAASYRVAERCDAVLASASARLDALARRIGRETHLTLRHADDRVVDLGRRVARRARRIPVDHAIRIDNIESRVANLDPNRLLARGWSITHTADGVLVRDAAQVSPGMTLLTRVASGTVSSTVDPVSSTVDTRSPSQPQENRS
ncbi:MAG: exodeoxyribonuclease VII large subunit [Acidimicrobiia bacterium]